MPLTGSKIKPVLALVIILVLGVLLLFRYTNIGEEFVVPTPKKIEALEGQLEDLAYSVAVQKKEQAEQRRKLEAVKAQVEPFFWDSGDGEPTTMIQKRIDILAREANVTLQRIGSSNLSDYSDNIRSVEITVRIRATMQEISRFFEALDQAEHRFFWKMVTMRPNSLREPTEVSFNARLQALIPSDSAQQILYDDADK